MSFPPVTIYTTKTCGYCKAAKELFQEHSVPFTEIDVGSDSTKAREMIERSGQMGVPVILVGNDMVIGFDQPKLQRLLGL
jgi:glutaredoxin-like YruB-family protein